MMRLSLQKGEDFTKEDTLVPCFRDFSGQPESHLCGAVANRCFVSFSGSCADETAGGLDWKYYFSVYDTASGAPGSRPLTLKMFSSTERGFNLGSVNLLLIVSSRCLMWKMSLRGDNEEIWERFFFKYSVEFCAYREGSPLISLKELYLRLGSNVVLQSPPQILLFLF